MGNAVSATSSKPPQNTDQPIPTPPPGPPPETPEFLPDEPGRICREPRAVVHIDDELKLCYELVIPCGVPEELAAERFRQEHGLEKNPAVRLQSSPLSTPSTPPAGTTSSSDDSNALPSFGLIEGLLEFFPSLVYNLF